MKLLIILLFMSLGAGAQSPWTFTCSQAEVKDSVTGNLKMRNAAIHHIATWTCEPTKKTITMTLAAVRDFKRVWSYDSTAVKTDKNGTVGQYYYLHRFVERDVLLLIYYPGAKKLVEIVEEPVLLNGVKKVRPIHVKYS